MPQLESEDILLRVPEPSDLDLLYTWENDINVWKSGCSITPFSRLTLSKYIETAHIDIFESKQLRLMIELKAPVKKTIGTIDLFDFDSYNNRAGIGILIFSEEDRKKKFATKALKLVIDYSFNILGLTQIYCNISPNNLASLKLFQKQGFEIIGLKKKWARKGSRFEDEYMLQLLNSSYI